MKVDQLTESCCQLTGHIDLDNLMIWKDEADKLPLEREIELDIGLLSFNGSAILSFLVFLLRRAAQLGGSLMFTNVPRRLVQMAELSELASILGLAEGT